jgi:enterochelin esterase-like enzyme
VYFHKDSPGFNITTKLRFFAAQVSVKSYFGAHSKIISLTRTDFSPHFIRFEGIGAGVLSNRTIDVLLPPGYHDQPGRDFPVLYMHDGQNLFDDKLSYSGQSWRAGDTASRLMQENAIEPAIICGIWNTSKRIGEYFPQRVLEQTVSDIHDNWFTKYYKVEVLSDAYLRLIMEDLHPLLLEKFRVSRRPKPAWLCGSSMGGLISLYGACEYAHFFAGAACLSTSWTIVGWPVIDYLKEKLPGPDDRRWYFDYGVEEHIGNYKHIQNEVDSLAERKGYRMNENWLTARFPGAHHSEAAWRDRLGIVLKHLMPA